ncbi:MAG: ABC transporter permease subunit [Bacteroidetes bacterium]|nr:ABC transporter permease subunit [Bacteroidota bacterium]
MFISILYTELFKIFRRPRTYISFGAIAVIVMLVQFALRVNGTEFIRFFTDSQADIFEIPESQILNGYFVCVAILHLILIHVPLLVALIAGDMIAGEAQTGTLRMLVAQPASRTTLLLAKFSASTIYVLLLLLWMALFALGGSLLLFGQEDLVVFRETDLHIISQQDVLWRFFAAFIYAALALTMIAALALLLSVFAENALGPIVATVCIVIVFTILQQLKVPVFEQTINPWSFTTHMLGWKGFFYVEQTSEGVTITGSVENPMALVKSGAILIAYTLLFVLVAERVYRKKDILC